MHQRDDLAHRSGGGTPSRPAGGNAAWIPPAQRLLSSAPPPGQRSSDAHRAPAQAAADQPTPPAPPAVDRRAVRMEGLALLSELALD